MAKKNTEDQTPETPKVMHEGLRSLYLELENFKNIDKKIIEIGGKSMIFLGKNGAGKSALIQGLTGSMDSKNLPEVSIKKGEERARIIHKIGGMVNGEYEEYNIDVFFTPKNQNGRVVITNKKGETMKSPSTMMKTIIGNVSFDPTKWLTEPKAKKLETIKALTGVGKQVDVINIEIKKLKEDLKYKKDRAEELDGALANHEFTKEDVEKYSTQVDLTAIQAEISEISAAQQQYDNVVLQLGGFQRQVEDAAKKINEAGAEINRLHALIKQQQNAIEEQTRLADTANGNIGLANNWLNSTQRPSIESVNQKLTDATIHNEKFNRIGMLGNQHREMSKLKMDTDALKLQVDTKENQRSELISKSQLPIEGLTYTDDEIFIDGLPLQDGQQNTQKLWDIGVDIAIALNPNLKMIFIHDGNIFDKEHLRSVIKKIEDKGYMAVVELVDFDGGELEARFTEEILDPDYDFKQKMGSLLNHDK